MSDEKNIENLDGNEEQEKEPETQTTEAQHLLEKEKELEAVNANIAEMEAAVKQYRQERLKTELPKVMREQYKQKEETSKAKLAELKAAQDQLQKIIIGIKYIIENKKNFDKIRVFSNIRELLKTKKSIKLGQLEKDAGSQPGYMSRLERGGNTSDPSVEFVVTAAKELGVPIDTLVNGTVGGVSPTEKLILSFGKRLINDTREDKISWERQSLAMLNGVYITDYKIAETSHPLYDFEGNPMNPDRIYYDSRFYPNEDVQPADTCYVAELPDTNSYVYLMSCMKDWDFFYELYLVGDDIKPVCCSSQSCSEVATMIDNLYKEIKLASNHVHLDNATRNIIGQYLDNEDVPF